MNNTIVATTPEANHAEENAQGHAQHIEAAAEAVAWLREHPHAPDEARELSREARALMHEHEWDGDNREMVAETIEDSLRESALSVEFRCSQWSNTASNLEPDEYRILLTYGGPALQITGAFDAHNGATTARLEWQDWWKPWTEYHGVDEDALLWFCSLFCLGDF
jgi:hypothetical protein